MTFTFTLTAFDCVDDNKLWKILQEMGLPDHFTGSEEVVPENLGVPLQGDRDAGELCGGASRVPSIVLTSNSYANLHLFEYQPAVS